MRLFLEFRSSRRRLFRRFLRATTIYSFFFFGLLGVTKWACLVCVSSSSVSLQTIHPSDTFHWTVSHLNGCVFAISRLRLVYCCVIRKRSPPVHHSSSTIIAYDLLVHSTHAVSSTIIPLSYLLLTSTPLPPTCTLPLRSVGLKPHTFSRDIY